jgi:hypothetical protein
VFHESSKFLDKLSNHQNTLHHDASWLVGWLVSYLVTTPICLLVNELMLPSPKIFHMQHVSGKEEMHTNV